MMLAVALMAILLGDKGCLSESLRHETTTNGKFWKALLSSDGAKLSSAVQATSSDQNSDSTYWLVNALYDGESSSSCQGAPIMETWLSSTFCYPGDGGTYFKIVCLASNFLETTEYPDATCSESSIKSVGQSIGCEINDADDDGYLAENGAWNWNMLSCRQGYPTNLAGNTLSRAVYVGGHCSSESLTTYQTGYVDTCYTNYDGTDYSSFQVVDEYRLDYNGSGCAGANVTAVEYLSSTCQSDGADAVLFTFYDEQSSSGGGGALSNSGRLAIGIVLSFVGGVILTLVAVYMWVRLARKAPLNQQIDKHGVQL